MGSCAWAGKLYVKTHAKSRAGSANLKNFSVNLFTAILPPMKNSMTWNPEKQISGRSV